MGAGHATAAEARSFGALLRRWRESRRVSQLELSLEAGVSARHISFMETGRATPSREMIVALASVLDVPLRERNVMMHAAGYAPVYRETSLDAPEMAQVRQALVLILKQSEPFGALVFDRSWNLVMANEGFVAFARALLGPLADPFEPYEVAPEPRLNTMKLLFDPAGWRPHIANWETVARSVLTRLQREAARDRDPGVARLLAEVLAFPGVPARWREPDFGIPQDLVIPVEMRVGDQIVRLFTTITSLGSPQDITLQELHIEAFHPADDASADFARALETQSRPR
jgi:transcriptional regulator with XRE-family HTH domain